jgi:prepilin-type N-terminal cleavage/methylation domain-containing protein
MKETPRGFTLVEIVVAALLLGIIGTIIVGLVVSGLRASARNQASIRCKENGKLVIETLEKEIAMAAPIQYYNRMPSGVILPSAFTSNSGAAHFFGLVTGESADNNYRWSADRVIFSELNSSTTNNPPQLTDYRYVELCVPSTARNTLKRKVFEARNAGGDQGIILSSSNDLGPDINYFNNDANLVNTGGTPVDETLISLPYPRDRVTFRVKRRAGADGYFNTFYQRNLLYIEVALYMTTGNEDWSDSSGDGQRYRNYQAMQKFIQSTTVNTK